MQSQQIVKEVEKRLMFSCNIMENEYCMNWLTEKLAGDGDESFKIDLFDPNTDRFERVLGKHQFSFKIDKDYFVWRLSRGSEQMYCISNEQGTFYQMLYSGGKQRFAVDEKMGLTIIEFLKELKLKLSDIAVPA